VSGGFAAKGASYGIESSFCKVEMERSRSCGMRGRDPSNRSELGRCQHRAAVGKPKDRLSAV